MLKFTFIALLFSLIVNAIYSQDQALLKKTESLLKNVVNLTVKFSDKNEEEQYGFGFITGEKDGFLYLATAAHVIRGIDGEKPNQILIKFYSDLSVYTAKEVYVFGKYDAAILQIAKPKSFVYQDKNWTDFDPERNRSVRFIGKNNKWIIAPGEISSLDGDYLEANLPSVRPGTSGAPLISEKGIVGLIIEDDDGEVKAIRLSKLWELFSEGGRYDYFNNANPNLMASPISQSRISEDDITTFSMVKIQGGQFRMGCVANRDGKCNNDEIPDRAVHLKSFYLSKLEVTNEEFARFLNEIASQVVVDSNMDKVTYQGKVIFDIICRNTKGECRFFTEHIEYNPEGFSGWYFTIVPGYEKHPVVLVSKYGAEAYCTWLSAKTGKVYRLPTEAEWEFAARGGLQSMSYRYVGSNKLDEVAWYKNNSTNHSHPVGQKKANELGLFDMSGNVWEWCSDWYKEKYHSTDPQKSTTQGDKAVLRGGSWFNVEASGRIAFRNSYPPHFCDYFIGFRIARDL